VLTPQQWVTERVAEYEQLLYGKTCRQCHQIEFAPAVALPVVAKSNITPRWMPHANFNHDRHQMVACTECHAALTSRETSDILMPGIAICEKCHHSGKDAAEARCFECHTYHDWSKAKEMKGKLTLSGLGE
jgi:predicted CXXCH cytochrome family protein